MLNRYFYRFFLTTIFFSIALFTLYCSKKYLSITNADLAFSSFMPVKIQTLNIIEQQKRLIVIGDVHGCLNSFERLIEKLDVTAEDVIVLAGDLVAKGPDSLGVLRKAKELGALCVRGNHDDEVLRWKKYLNTVTEELLEESNLPNGLVFGEHQEIASSLPEELFSYLVSCPVILSVPQYELLIVHGGVDPTKSLEVQDEYVVMNIRNILDNGSPTRKTSHGTSWSKIWNRIQSTKEHPTTIVYGHAAVRGLSVKPYSIGLDTGCVKGKELTAMMFPSKELISVKCHKHDL
ncbi:hypothetical protein K7432_012658 [Basidiobolus ranarum]|uniref:Calcineurin-like phosphoesterase domain-containing protein n=1 Tax=Basidiobolus ranarum TaxID=34480 RepID=A0ABR2VRX2_9FUNG